MTGWKHLVSWNDLGWTSHFGGQYISTSGSGTAKTRPGEPPKVRPTLQAAPLNWNHSVISEDVHGDIYNEDTGAVARKETMAI